MAEEPTMVLCTACQEHIPSGEALRAHYRSDRHQYNVKRKMEGMPPIPEAVWEAKLQRFAEIQQAQEGKKTDHIKKKLNRNKQAPSEAGVDASNVTKREIPLECKSLFDSKHFRSVEKNLDYMRKKYTFVIPEATYCHDVPGFLKFLHGKIGTGFQCLYCDRTFESKRDCLQHMIDKNHTRIGMEGYTRQGNYSEDATNELLSQMEPFYDFSSSYKELKLPVDMPNRAEADQAAAAIMDKSGEDKALKKAREAKWLIRIIEHFASDEQSASSSKQPEEATEAATEEAAPAETARALDFARTAKFFAFFSEGDMGALTEEQFGMWTKDFGGEFCHNALRQFYEVFECELGEEHERFLETFHEEELDALLEERENEEEALLKSDDTKEVIECEDEAEFARVMAAYGLKPAKVLDDGSLRLPDGTIAGHRKWNYIYKQKGVRMDPKLIEEKRLEKKALAIRGFGARAALGNGESASQANNTQLALVRSGRLAVGELKKQGKQVMAILRKQQVNYMQVGVKKNKMPKNNQGIAMYYCQ